MIRNFAVYNLRARPITSATAPIQVDEFRVAFRMAPNGWHIIYQLSNGNWASKNAHWDSVYESSSTARRLWADRRFYDRRDDGTVAWTTWIITSTISGSNTYLAVRRR